MIGQALLLLLVALPLLAAAVAHIQLRRGSERARQPSLVFALLLALACTLAVIDVELPLAAGRSLVLTPPAQLGIQLIALMALGLVLALEAEPPEIVADWLPVLWVGVFGLTLALLLSELPLALLALLGAALLWVFGLSGRERTAAPDALMRYGALLALLMPLLLLSFRIATERTSTTPELERLVLAFAVPGFGLLLGVMPLHAWALTLASGAPRMMLFAAVGLVQTAGVSLLLQTVTKSPWLTEGAHVPLMVGGAVSALAGGWLALSSRLDDQDDFLIYALVANSGFLLAGLGARSEAAAAGVALLLLGRVLALVVLALVPQVSGLQRRIAVTAALLTLAGTPGLAGFPGLWLVLRRLLETTAWPVPIALLLGSLLLFATAVRRWSVDDEAGPPVETIGGRRAVVLLVVLLALLGVLPQLFAPAFTGATRGMFFLP